MVAVPRLFRSAQARLERRRVRQLEQERKRNDRELRRAIRAFIRGR